MLQLENANVSIEMMHSQVTELILQLENANATIEAINRNQATRMLLT